jgi:hypothetical protein
MSPIFKSVFNALMGIDNDLIHEQFLERDYTKLELLLKEKSITLTRLAQCINFYPGTKSNVCHEYAFFVSLQDQPKNSRLKLREYVKFDELLQQVVRHCQGSCSHNTWRIGILADNLDNASLKFWKHNLMEIQKSGIEIEFYLLVAGNPVEISLANVL